jgi:methanogenic corrinoid protein MtbC1
MGKKILEDGEEGKRERGKEGKRITMLKKIIKEYNDAVFDTDRDRALDIVRNAVIQGVSPEEVVFEVVLPAMDLMIKAISENMDANLAQHFMTAQIADTVTAEMVSKFQKAPEIVGTVVIGTAMGDMHSLGKRIVIGCLRARMIDVTDLGVNVPPERFVDEATAKNADVIGVSAMMVHTAKGENGCLAVRRVLKERGLERKVRIIVGGAPFRFDENMFRMVQADACALDGVTAGKVIADLIREIRRS